MLSANPVRSFFLCDFSKLVLLSLRTPLWMDLLCCKRDQSEQLMAPFRLGSDWPNDRVVTFLGFIRWCSGPWLHCDRSAEFRGRPSWRFLYLSLVSEYSWLVLISRPFCQGLGLVLVSDWVDSGLLRLLRLGDSANTAVTDSDRKESSSCLLSLCWGHLEWHVPLSCHFLFCFVVISLLCIFSLGLVMDLNP